MGSSATGEREVMDAANPRTPEEIVLADPMLGVLREHHPDVDVVLLPTPPTPRPAEVDPVATPADLARLAQETDHLLDTLVARLTRHPSWPQHPEREARWRHDRMASADHGLAHRESLVVATGLAEGDNVALLRASGNGLLGLGWQARPVPGSRPRLVARRGPFTASAMVREGSVQLTIGSRRVVAALADLR